MEYKPKDFKSDVLMKWCPGCGDYAITNSLQRAMAEMGKKHEDYVVISGIGCSSRLPYYMNTYGFHTIHGRGAAIASGVKMTNGNLAVFLISGDGDSMAIGGNHFIHMLRRNVDINMLLFNNKIYGLTKGQTSPTSEIGKKTKTAPYGTIEESFNPGNLLLGANGSFFARSVDLQIDMTKEIIIEAEKHKGTSVVELLQNCVIFNNGVHGNVTEKSEILDRQIYLKHGEKMIFGKEREKGLILENGSLKAVVIGENGITEDDILVHNAKEDVGYLHTQLINMWYPEFPVAMGVIRSIERPVYNEEMEKQMESVKENSSISSVHELIYSGDTWEVK